MSTKKTIQRKLSREEINRIDSAIARAKRDSKVPASAQQTIPTCACIPMASARQRMPYIPKPFSSKILIISRLRTRTRQPSLTTGATSSTTLPLVPAFKEKLLAAKAQQECNRKLCGRSYNKEFIDYVCVNELGVRIRPSYVTTAFPKLLEDHGLRKIRFHDFRHSCASLQLANNVSMKQIQDWLGHSDFATTANIYSHLDFDSNGYQHKPWLMDLISSLSQSQESIILR